MNYRTVLPWTPPHERDFYRGDAWGVEMPNAPIVPGVGRRPDRIMSYLLGKYPRDFQQAYLTEYVRQSYSHLLLSADDALGPVDNPGHSPGAGLTLDQLVALCKLAKTYVPYVKLHLASSDFTAPNPTLDQYRAKFQPVLEALLPRHLIDEVVPAWEMNELMAQTPGQPTIDICRWVGQFCRPYGVSTWLHFTGHVTSWFKDGDSRGRFGFWQDLQGDVAGLDYQTRGVNWSYQMLQSRLVDTLWHFGDVEHNRYKLRLCEDYANWEWDMDAVTVTNQDDVKNPDGTDRFTHVDVTPDYANLRGYIGLCTIDDVRRSDAKVWGGGNGFRMPDGTPI